MIMQFDPFNLSHRGLGIFFVIAGVFIVIEGLTRPYLVSEEGALARREDQERFKATPRRRALVVALGLICIAFGVFQAIG